jgi:hypothetical protein
VCGEVREETIVIFESDSTKALDALKHEFIDYLVSKAIRPYEKAEKEKVVEALRRTIS